MIHGMSEEVGEMNHWYLKGKQKIRGVTPEIAKEKMADAFADTVVFGIQAMTCLGLDAEKVLKEVFDEVLKRDWVDNPEGIGYSQHNQ
jgi:NTP pyrophosphatase (non-canonical NTP hydrolase)